MQGRINMADVVLNITIPDAYVLRTLAAFNTIVDTHITIEARGHGDPKNEFNGHMDFTIQPNQAGETNKQFGERVFRSLGLAVIKMVEKEADEDRYRTAVATIPPPTEKVPTDILR